MIKYGGELKTGDLSNGAAFSAEIDANPLANLGGLSESPEFQAVPAQVPSCAAVGK